LLTYLLADLLTNLLTNLLSNSTCTAATGPLVGKSIRDIKFRSRYNAVVLAVHREGVRVHARVGDVVGLYMLNAVDP
jgi:hypothetical protein